MGMRVEDRRGMRREEGVKKGIGRKREANKHKFSGTVNEVGW
jgi:hypothetical protein